MAVTALFLMLLFSCSCVEKGKKKKKLDDNLNIENSPVKEEVSIATEESETERTVVKKKKKKKHKKDGHDESLVNMLELIIF